MSAKDTLGNAPGLKEHEAKQNRVAHSSPNRPDGIAACCDALNEHRVNCNTYKDLKGRQLPACREFSQIFLCLRNTENADLATAAENFLFPASPTYYG